MKYFVIHTLFACCLVLMPQAVRAAQITEIMYDLEGSDDKREWIEIYNETNEPLNLNDWSLTIGTETSRHTLVFGSDKGGRGSGVLAGGEFAVIASDAVTFSVESIKYIGQIADSVFSLPNYSASRTEPIVIRLYDALGVERAVTNYLPAQDFLSGRSLEFQDDHWTMSVVVGGSPGAVRSDAAIVAGSFRLHALLPDPQGSDIDNEWITIENYGESEASLAGWYVTDRPTASGAVHKQVVEPGVTLGPGKLYTLHLSGSFLNNSDEEVTLCRPDGIAVDVAGFSTSAEEGIAYIRTADGWHWDVQAASTIKPELAVNTSTTVPKTNVPGTIKASPMATKSSSSTKPSQSKTPTKSPTPKVSGAKKTTPTPSLPTDVTQVAGLMTGPPTITLSHRIQIVLAIFLLLAIVGVIIYRYQLHYRLSDWIRYAILKEK